MTWSKGLLFFGLLLLLLIFKASLQALLGDVYFIPDVGFLFLAYVSFSPYNQKQMRANSSETDLVGVVLWVVGVGYLVDLFSATPRGMQMLAYGIFSLLLRALSTRVWFQSILFLVVSIFFTHVSYQLVLHTFRIWVKISNGWFQFFPTVIQAVSTAFFAAILFPLLRKLETVLLKKNYAGGKL